MSAPGLAGNDAAGEVAFLARELKTPIIADVFTTLGDKARTAGWSHDDRLPQSLSAAVPTGPVHIDQAFTVYASCRRYR